MKPLSNVPRIRRAGAADVDFVRRVAEQVLAPYGDYGPILPYWLLQDGVFTHIAESREGPLGYTMLGFFPVGAPRQHPLSLFGPDSTREADEGAAADLLAIAVARAAQGRGVGRLLLEHVFKQVVAAARRRMNVLEVRLSVADTNVRARRLFEDFGFELVQGDHGRYDGGQRVLHMVRRL